MLRREDIHLQASPPYINIPKERGRGKSPGDVPIMPEQASLLRLWLTEGVTVERKVRVNQNGFQTRHDKYVLPSSGRLFPCRQTTYKKKRIKRDHLGYHAVWSAVRKAAEAFCKTQPEVARCWKQLRTHSGRSTKITMLMGEGVSLAMSMKFARHAQTSIKTHLGYGKLTVKDIHRYLLAERGRGAALLATKRGEKPMGEPSEPDTAPMQRRLRKKTSTQAPARIGLNPTDPLTDCTLKDAIAWHEKGLLNESEFAKVKQNMIGRLQVSDGAE